MARAKAAFEKARGTYHPSLVRFSSGNMDGYGLMDLMEISWTIVDMC